MFKLLPIVGTSVWRSYIGVFILYLALLFHVHRSERVIGASRLCNILSEIADSPPQKNKNRGGDIHFRGRLANSELIETIIALITETIRRETKFSRELLGRVLSKERTKRERGRLIRTSLFNSKSVFATMHLYHTSHSALFTANEANKFIWRVVLAHLRELYSKEG